MARAVFINIRIGHIAITWGNQADNCVNRSERLTTSIRDNRQTIRTRNRNLAGTSHLFATCSGHCEVPNCNGDRCCIGNFTRFITIRHHIRVVLAALVSVLRSPSLTTRCHVRHRILSQSISIAVFQNPNHTVGSRHIGKCGLQLNIISRTRSGIRDTNGRLCVKDNLYVNRLAAGVVGSERDHNGTSCTGRQIVVCDGGTTRFHTPGTSHRRRRVGSLWKAHHLVLTIGGFQRELHHGLPYRIQIVVRIGLISRH